MRYELAPEGRAYWRDVERAYKQQKLDHERRGIPPPDPLVKDEPKPNRRNQLAWICWGFVYPDCCNAGLTGMGLFAWDQVAVVLRDFYGIEPTGHIHGKLRICMSEALSIGREGKDVKADG